MHLRLNCIYMTPGIPDAVFLEADSQRRRRRRLDKCHELHTQTIRQHNSFNEGSSASYPERRQQASLNVREYQTCNLKTENEQFISALRTSERKSFFKVPSNPIHSMTF